MSVYTHTSTLRSCDVDAERRLRPSVLLTMLQEAAIAHTTELGMGREKTLDRGLLWIIVLQDIRIKRLPVYDEEVCLSSRPGKTMHLYFPRYAKLADRDGNELLSASTLWALMDRESRHIVFPEEYGIRIKADESAPALPLPAMPRLPQLKQTAAFTVPYSYTDLNGHMNNTRYLDLAQDILPVSFRARTLCRIVTEYSGEAKEGDTLLLETASDENRFCLQGSLSQRVFRLVMEYTQA